jgi:c-di-GMP-binding flagellar brake protein YcgR
MLFNRLNQQSNAQVDKPIESSDLISDKQQIIQVLSSLQRNHCLLQARIIDHTEVFTTTVLGINPKTNIMALDEISPKSGHDLFIKEKAIHLSGRTDGIAMECDLALIATRQKSKIPYYQVGIPDWLIYRQRRNDHRVTLLGLSYFRGHVQGHDERAVDGYAVDISMHGIGVILKKENKIKRGDRISDCLLQIIDEEKLCFNLEIRFVHHVEDRNITRLGGRFLEMNNKEKNRIAKLIRKLERKHAQIIRDGNQ